MIAKFNEASWAWLLAAASTRSGGFNSTAPINGATAVGAQRISQACAQALLRSQHEPFG